MNKIKKRKQRKEQFKRYCAKHMDVVREGERRRQQERRMIVLKHYSGETPRCQCCGETIYEFLTIDHIEGGGTKHRNTGGAHDIVKWLIKNNFPEGFRVLCFNCNCSRRGGECPHKRLQGAPFG